MLRYIHVHVPLPFFPPSSPSLPSLFLPPSLPPSLTSLPSLPHTFLSLPLSLPPSLPPSLPLPSTGSLSQAPLSRVIASHYITISRSLCKAELSLFATFFWSDHTTRQDWCGPNDIQWWSTTHPPWGTTTNHDGQCGQYQSSAAAGPPGIGVTSQHLQAGCHSVTAVTR